MPSLKLLPFLAVVAIASSTAAIAQQAPADRQDSALAYAQCIRDHGYAEFPDPAPDGGFQFLINPENAPRFKAAADACRAIAPEGMRDDEITPEDLEALVKLAQCVRENGIPNFPDPDAAGHFDPRSVGIGPDDPRFRSAMAACKDKAGPGGRIVIGG